jgi:VWFA-related protein
MNCPQKFPAANLTLWLALWLAVAAPVLSQSEPGPTLRGPGQQPSGQQAPPPPAQDQRARIRTTVSLVVVPVTIKNRSGGLVTGLDKNDFRIFEDAYEQEIAQFSSDAFPLSAIILIDDDLKRSTADRVKQTLQTVAGGFSPLDEVSLWRFDDVPQQLSDFIASNDDLLTQLQRVDLDSSFPGSASAPMTGGPVTNTQPLPGPLQIPTTALGHPNNKHINDAVYEAAEQLRDRAKDHRKIIFLISDGQNAKNNTHSYADTLKLLLSSDISVYAVGVGEANLNHGLNVLARLAHATGGDIFYGSSRSDLEALYPRVTEQARNQYTLAYAPSQTDRSAPYHAIEVRVRRPGLNIVAREGYYPGGLQ